VLARSPEIANAEPTSGTRAHAASPGPAAGSGSAADAPQAASKARVSCALLLNNNNLSDLDGFADAAKSVLEDPR